MKNNLIVSHLRSRFIENAVIDGTKRNSSSSEDAIDTSDENLVVMDEAQNTDKIIDDLISEQRKQAGGNSTSGRYVNDGQVPSTSRQHDATMGRPKVTPEQRAMEIIQMAEKNKAQVYETPGENNMIIMDNHEPIDMQRVNNYQLDLQKGFVHSAMVDEHYLMVGNHIEETLKAKIVKGEYVDFAKLIGKDRIMEEEGSKYQNDFPGREAILDSCH